MNPDKRRLSERWLGLPERSWLSELAAMCASFREKPSTMDGQVIDQFCFACQDDIEASGMCMPFVLSRALYAMRVRT